MKVDKIKAIIGLKKRERNTKKEKGIVKYFNGSRGYGYIRSDLTLMEIYFHEKDTIGEIKIDDLVQFELEERGEGMRAKNVEAISS